MAIVFGRARIKVGNTWVRLKTGAKATGIGGVERNAVVGHEVHGFTETAVAPTLEFSVTVADDISVTEMADLTDTTVIFESYLKNGTIGKAFVGRNFWNQSPPEVTDGEGEGTFVFQGYEWDEL